jgi:hypothetical protein
MFPARTDLKGLSHTEEASASSLSMGNLLFSFKELWVTSAGIVSLEEYEDYRISEASVQMYPFHMLISIFLHNDLDLALICICFS